MRLTLPTDSGVRKEYPMLRGLLHYFPAVLAGVANHSKVSNDKHNPGEPMHHARGKSMDHGDCIVRHLTDLADMVAAVERGGYASDEMVKALLYECNAMGWRALALGQEMHERFGGAPLAPAARLTSPNVPAFDAMHEPQRCDVVDPNNPSNRCALVAGHDGLHKGETMARAVRDHTCAIGDDTPCVVCEEELGKLPAGADRGEPTPTEQPDRGEPTQGFDPAD